MAILKLGGSVITHKDETPPRLNIETIRRIAKELRNSSTSMLVVLGGGAHGHQAAHSFGYGDSSTPTSKLLLGIPRIRHNMTELSSAVETVFNQEGISAVVIAPFSIASLQDGQILSFSLDTIKMALDAGHNVITHGDVCFDHKLGASILSGDTIVVYLAKAFQIKRILIGTDVDGVLDNNPNASASTNTIPIINQSNKESILKLVGPSNATDVTGGMAKKIQDLFALSGMGFEITIFNLNVPGRLESLLKGASVPCTRVFP